MSDHFSEDDVITTVTRLTRRQLVQFAFDRKRAGLAAMTNRRCEP